MQTLTALDIFGLWGAKQSVSLAASALVLPELYPVTLSLSERCVPDADSAEYSMTRPGDDPSETLGLREYQAGDRLRSIHWKLSEKTGGLMVRQLGLPVDDTLLLVLDNSAAAPPAPAEREALGEAVISVSAAVPSGLCPSGGVAGSPRRRAGLPRRFLHGRADGGHARHPLRRNGGG